MQFHVEFKYRPEEREKLIRLLDVGALQTEAPLRIVDAWIAVETGTAYVIVETTDAKLLYSLCSTWSEHGCVKVSPLLSIKELPHN